jgi:hypothetical protein
MLFTYARPDDSYMQRLYHVSTSDVLSTLTPEGERLRDMPADIVVISAPDGSTTVWFNTGDWTVPGVGTLYAYVLPADDSVAMAEPDLVVENAIVFHSSPTGAYVVAQVKDEAVLIDAATFAQTATGSDFDTRAVFFDDDDQPHVADGRVRFVDTAREIVYFAPVYPPMEQDDFVLYAASYDGVDPVQVHLPDVNLPFSLHWYTFNLMPNGDVVYFGEDLQTLYRARCQRND